MTEPRPLRLYRFLLRLFPRDFREHRGQEMERLFLDMSGQWERERRRLGPRFWWALMWDTATEALAERLDRAREAVRMELSRSLGEQMSTLVSDVRLALRQVRREPAYALMVLALIAVGIAGNVAVFRVLNGLFLRPLPFEAPEQLVDLDETAPAWDLEYLSIAYRDFDTWRAENNTFQSMAVLDEGGGNLIADGPPRRVDYLLTSHDIDDVLRMAPLLGRFYGPEEDHPDGPRAALLAEGFWRQEFAGDPEVLGRQVQLDGLPVEIIGVLPARARFLSDADMWLPLRQTRTDWRGWELNGIGRLRPEVSLERARQDLLAIHKGMIPEFPVNEISSPVIHSFRDRYLGEYRLGSGFLFGAVAIVLLISCANIAGLLFVRSLVRSSEMSVRLAIGAPRSRIVRQLLTEGMVFAGLGGAVGVLLGVFGSGVLVASLSDQFPTWVTFDLDARFVLFTVGVTAASVLLFALAPAVRASRAAPGSVGGTRSTAGRAQRRWMGLLVAGEVAMALALLVVGGLAVLDVQRLGRVDPGFRAEGLIAYSLTLPAARYEDGDARTAFVDAYLPRLDAIPGVESAAIASAMPLGSHWGWFFVADGSPPRSEGESNPVVLNRMVSPSYFETAGVELLAGRAFDEFDAREDGNGVLVVNERFVETHLSHLDDPIGAQVTPETDARDDSVWWTVIGVARNVKHYGVDEDMRPGVYQPFRQFPTAGFHVALRVRGDPAAVIGEARAVTADLDVELPVYDVLTMTDELAQSLWTRRATSWLIGAFSVVALLLAVAGIYGVISYTVAQRTKEISIRMAMGARAGDVSGQVLRQGMGLVLVGVIVGLLVSLVGAGRMSEMLVGVGVRDPVVYIGVTLVLVLVAAVANYIPARRAAALDPMQALRRE